MALIQRLKKAGGMDRSSMPRASRPCLFRPDKRDFTSTNQWFNPL